MDRKARLKSLAKKAGRAKEQPSDDVEMEAAVEQPSTAEPEEVEPQTKKMRTADARKADDTKEEETGNHILQQALEQAQAQSTQVVDPLSAAPKSINWDLKRDIQPRLDRLEKRTQRAIVQLLRERLEQEAAADLD